MSRFCNSGHRTGNPGTSDQWKLSSKQRCASASPPPDDGWLREKHTSTRTRVVHRPQMRAMSPAVPSLQRIGAGRRRRTCLGVDRLLTAARVKRSPRSYLYLLEPPPGAAPRPGRSREEGTKFSRILLRSTKFKFSKFSRSKFSRGWPIYS
eukprot:SAG31_NODE_2120_length_6405_cov_3.062639_2_plen_151_part_00